MEATELSQKVAQLALQKKGEDILIFDLRQLTDVADFFVLVTGGSDLHVKAIADFIEDELEKLGIRLYHKEGYENLRWVLLDYVDVVVHIFRPETRDFYNLERLWADATITRVEDDVTTD